MRLKKQFGEIRNTSTQLENNIETSNKNRNRKISESELSTNASHRTNKTLNSQNMNSLIKQSVTTNNHIFMKKNINHSNLVATIKVEKGCFTSNDPKFSEKRQYQKNVAFNSNSIKNLLSQSTTNIDSKELKQS